MKKWIYNVLFILCVAVVVYAALKIYNQKEEYKKAETEYEQLQKKEKRKEGKKYGMQKSLQKHTRPGGGNVSGRKNGEGGSRYASVRSGYGGEGRRGPSKQFDGI